jgi:hypothetical protein
MTKYSANSHDAFVREEVIAFNKLADECDQMMQDVITELTLSGRSISSPEQLKIVGLNQHGASGAAPDKGGILGVYPTSC